MGEQSAKHLRGSGMQDVIFAGCEARGPMGLCEVTITFHNDGNLVPPEYQGCDEISVTRRLFRDGTSEYCINKVLCRLRDILDLFMGTGIGKNAYSIIEQGRIGLIVTAKPEDRRAFIEDAAGVSRYKARRKQAERRIAATEQNLLRINDLTDELGQRLASLKRQADKAERYKRLKEGAAHAGSVRSRSTLLGAARPNGLSRVVGCRTATAGHGWRRDDVDREARLSERQDELAKVDEALRERENTLHAHRQALALAEIDAAYLVRQKQSLSDRETEAVTEQGTLQQEQANLMAEQAEAADRGRALEEADDEQKLLDERSAALEQGRSRLKEAQEQLETTKQALVDSFSSIAQHRNGLANIERTRRRYRSADQPGHGFPQGGRRARACRRNQSHRSIRKARTQRQLKLRLDDRRVSKKNCSSRCGTSSSSSRPPCKRTSRP